MYKNNIQKTVNDLLLRQLRQAFVEEGAFTKNVTFSLSDEVIQKIEEISKSNKQLEKQYKISGLPITKSDILSNAIETYYKAYSEGLYDLNLELDEEGTIKEIIEDNEGEQKEVVADTIIVPARYGGEYERVFFEERQWYAVKVAEWRLKNLKYLGVYVGSPVSQVTHYAPIKSFSPYKGDPGKYQFELGEPIKLDRPITLAEYNRSGLQRSVYTTLDHLMKCDFVHEITEWWIK